MLYVLITLCAQMPIRDFIIISFSHSTQICQSHLDKSLSWKHWLFYRFHSSFACFLGHTILRETKDSELEWYITSNSHHLTLGFKDRLKKPSIPHDKRTSLSIASSQLTGISSNVVEMYVIRDLRKPSVVCYLRGLNPWLTLTELSKPRSGCSLVR